METREWALLVFTILAQMSVGAFCVLGVIHTYAMRKYGEEEADRLSDRALLAIGVTLVLGIGASFFHLGNPLNAPRALLNVGSSWLSREILFGVLFGATGAVFALLQWRKIGSFRLRNIIAWIAALIGLVLVYAMSHIYMLETQPAWNNFATPIQFYITTFLLGSLAIGAALSANYAYLQREQPECAAVQCELLKEAVRGISLTGLALLGLELVLIPVQIAFLANAGGPAGVTAGLMFGQYGVLLVLRLVLVFVGAGVFGFFLYRNAESVGAEPLFATLIYAAFALVLIAEVMGRVLFYATPVKIGL